MQFKLTTTQFRKEMLTLLIELTRQLRNDFGILFFNNNQHWEGFHFQQSAFLNERQFIKST